MANYLRWRVLGSLFVACVVFDLFVAFVFDDNEDLRFHFTLGVCSAQMSILAVWTALGPSHAFVRASTGLVLASLLALSLLMIDDDSDPGMLVICCGLFGQWLALQLPLGVARLVFGWHVSLAKSELTQQRSETQFEVRHILLLTGLVAILLGIARILVADAVSDLLRDEEYIHYIALIVFPLIFISLSAIPIIWAAFARRRLWFWLAVSGACAIALAMAEVLAFQLVSKDVAPYALYRVSFFHYVACCGSLLIIRWCGFRLIRLAEG